MAKNADCAASDTALCRWIGKECSGCQMHGMKRQDDVKKAVEDFEVTLSLLPEDIDTLQGEECQFCKGEKRKRAGYALFDLAHSEPKSETGMFFGIGKKVRRKVGSLIPLSIAVCRECKRALWMSDLIKWITAAVLLAISIIVVTIPGVKNALDEMYLFAIVIGSVLVGYIAGKFISASYVNAKSKDVRFNVFEIPVCAKMRDNGWFTVQDDTPVTRFIFSRKPQTRTLKSIDEGESEAH